MFQPLLSTFLAYIDNDRTLLWARNRAFDTDEVVFWRQVRNAQVLYSNLLCAHVTSHALTLEDLLWVHATDRTDLTRVTLTTVGLAVTFEVVTFDSTRPTFTL
jgi:hypothetical protein